MLLAILVTGTMMGAVAMLVFGRDKILAGLFGPVDFSAVEFADFSGPTRPNEYLVCPEDRCADSRDAVSPTFAVSAADLMTHWQNLMATEPNVTVVTSDLQPTVDEWQQTYVQRSKVFAFPDLITVRFEALDPGRSTLMIFSRSAYGKLDGGVNRRRVADWLEALAQQASND